MRLTHGGYLNPLRVSIPFLIKKEKQNEKTSTRLRPIVWMWWSYLYNTIQTATYHKKRGCPYAFVRQECKNTLGGKSMKSVLSYPNRGHWGKNDWRGNMSGHIVKDLIEHFQPHLFVDACEGSGTSRYVCREMGIEYVGLDLYKGNDFTKDSILSHLKRPADICFTHPPYHNMITYSGEVYGHKAMDGDTSRCATPEEFIARSHVMLLNQRDATKEGGIYATLIGDHRKNGEFRSYQSDFIQLMPKSELLSVAIKLQHNCVSNSRHYSGGFVPILHEYLLLWKKSSRSLFAVSLDTTTQLQKRIASTWRNVIRMVLMKLKEASLADIYTEVERVAGEMIAKNAHWQAKIRQQLQRHFTHVKRGIWTV